MNRNILSLSCALSLGGTALVAQTAGFSEEQVFMPHHDAPTRVVTWYPGSGGETQRYGENPVFQGVDAAMGAAVTEGAHPVVLFSHGMGGTDRAQAWLGAGLAARGAIVVIVNHPGSTWGDFDMARGVQHWTRAQDMQAALDALMADPRFADHVDPARIMAAGFSFGGWTALSLGGVTGNHAGSVAACTTHRATMEACDMLLSDRVGLAKQDPAEWNASYADDRVTDVFAIDPGFVWGLSADNAAGLQADTILVGFGGPEDRMQATDFDASGLSAHLATAQTVQFDPAYHFSAMPLCTPMGAAILEEEGDDPVCTDPAGSDRAKIHADIVDLIAEALGL